MSFQPAPVQDPMYTDKDQKLMVSTWKLWFQRLLTYLTSTFAPLSAKYVVQTTDVLLPNAQSLGSLAAGILKNTATAGTGVLSISNVTDDVQTKAAIVPNTAPTAGQILVGNAGNTAYAPQSMSSDASLASTGAITVTKSTNVKGGNNTTLKGAIPYQSDTDTTSLLSPNVTTTKKFLRETGTGTNGNVPAWDTVVAADVTAGALADGMTATTQPFGDDSTKIATTAFTQDAVEVRKDKCGWNMSPPQTGKLAIAKPSTNWIFTLTADTGGTFEYYVTNTEVIVTGNKTYDLGASPTANTALHYFYFDDATGTIKHNETGFNLYLVAPIATAFFNGTSWAITEERHYAIRDRSWHIWAHTTIGARITASDFAMTAPAVGLNNTVNIAGGTLHDEDLIHTPSASTSVRLWYKTAAAAWTFVDPATTPYDGSVKYTDAGYNQVDVAANRYINQWYYVTPDIAKTVYTVREVVAAPYTTVALARAVPPPDLALLNFKGSMECKILYRVIWKGDETVQEVTDYRASSPVAGGGAGAVSAAAVAYTPTSPVTNVTVQGALDQLTSGIAPSAGVIYTGTTYTAAGLTGAGALPATPEGFIAITVGGVTKRIPYYPVP